ncbi:hypothetical protein [Phyllobacterium sp. OV277]|uniref:hypothetical protein n=1 Tax=Phyllobacterium sp. OV277 TaxID=1882772 RepID=UPI0008825B69|nr:hypothetical protein [Phyllobacterium sp. OV277]SDO18086.1 hypothetical protein SAMN05443582_1011203 [Phyllobacterium sp. OV277]
MKLSLTAGIGLFSFFAVAALFADFASFTASQPANVDPTMTASTGLTEFDAPAFVISSPGGSARCKAFPQENGLPGHDALHVNKDCAALYAPLANATEWRNNPDGTIAFADQSGKTIVEFSPGDGRAYVSVAPRSVLLSLSAAGVDLL